MTVLAEEHVVEDQGGYRFNAQHLATASVSGNNPRAVEAAQRILFGLAEDMGLSQIRAGALQENSAKDAAAIFAASLASASLNFASVGNEFKAPASVVAKGNDAEEVKVR